MIQSPPSTLYCARSILLVASRAVNWTTDGSAPFAPLWLRPPALSPSITGGVLSTTKRSLSRSVVDACAGGFEGASLAMTLR